jgi:hypothetical protein
MIIIINNKRVKGLLKANRDRHGDEILGSLKKTVEGAAAAEATTAEPMDEDVV